MPTTVKSTNNKKKHEKQICSNLLLWVPNGRASELHTVGAGRLQFHSSAVRCGESYQKQHTHRHTHTQKPASSDSLMFFEQYAHTHTRSECNARTRSFSLSQSRSFIYMRKRELCNWNTTQLYILRGIRTNRMWRTEDGLFFHSRCPGRAGRQGGQSLHSAHTLGSKTHTHTHMHRI